MGAMTVHTHPTGPTARTMPVIEGPIEKGRFGSIGFRLRDEHAPAQCRHATRELLQRFHLQWVRSTMGDVLTDDVLTIVSELVTNACAYGGDSFPAGSLTIWHPNRHLIIAVHDKNPVIPWDAWLGRGPKYGPGQPEWVQREGGRGIRLVKALAAHHLGELDYVSDDDQDNPGKVARVKMLLPNVIWPYSFRDPWTGREVNGGPERIMT